MAPARGLVSGEGWWGKKYGQESGVDAGNFSLTVLLSSEFPPFSPTICLLVRGLSPSSAAEDIMHLSLIYLTWSFFYLLQMFFSGEGNSLSVKMYSCFRAHLDRVLFVGALVTTDLWSRSAVLTRHEGKRVSSQPW